MNHLGKTLRRPATDALRRTVRCDQLRTLLFEFPEASEQGVIFGVGNFRVVVNVIEFIVMTKLVTRSSISCLVASRLVI